MRKIILFILCVITSPNFGQISINPNNTLDQSIENLWIGNTPTVPNIQNIGPESLGQNQIIAPVLPPAKTRTSMPGDKTIILPIESTDGPLNLSPYDAKAYILYNRATIAYRKHKFEEARNLYRELLRRYPDSSYSPYALYTLSLSEKDYRRKISILLTIKERFPHFPHKDIILDRLGDIYYILDSHDAAEEVFKQSKSPYALYMRGVIALDSQRPNAAIKNIRKFLATIPDNESAYKGYMLYTEALLLLKSYKNSLTILEKAVKLRPWAYDNGAMILLNAGKAFYYSKKYDQALYAFSVLRLRFSRSTESRLADQFLVSLGKLNVVHMKTVPWIAENFDTLIQEQPVVNFRIPKYPSMKEILSMNTSLPPSAIKAPSLDSINYLPSMPIPEPVKNTHSILVPINQNGASSINIITFTNTVFQEITNTIYREITNKVFTIETNTITNTFVAMDNHYITNTITNILKLFETNTIKTYEPIIIWKTNYRQLDITNLITNFVNQVVTNSRIEVVPLWRTNYNLINRTKNITNVIEKIITNRFLELIPRWVTNRKTITRTNNLTNIVDQITTNTFMEVIPRWKTIYKTIDKTNNQTNIINEVVTNTRIELIPSWFTNTITNNINLTNTITNIINSIITNTFMEVIPHWQTNNVTNRITITNSLTNIVDEVITNTKMEIIPRWVTNSVINNVTNTITNYHDEVITNTKMEIIPRWVTNNVINNVTNTITNYRDEVITNTKMEIIPRWITRDITNSIIVNVTNFVNEVITNTHWEIVPRWFTNNINRINTITNYHDAVITNTKMEIIPRWITNRVINNITNTITNYLNEVITNTRMEIIPRWFTNNINLTNTKTNMIDEIVTNTKMEIIPRWINRNMTNTINMTNVINSIVTNSRIEVIPRWATNILTVIHTNAITNLVNMIITNVNNQLQTNVVDMIVTNIENQVQTNVVDMIVTNVVDLVKTNMVNQIFTNLVNVTNISVKTNNGIISSNTNVYAEPAPIPASDMPIIMDDPQEEFILEPIYEKPVEEPQVLFVTDDVARLESQASQFAEKASGIAGEYSFPDNKGFVVRIAQLKDLSVANIVVKDINRLDSKIPVGIYYRDELYYVEVRNISDYETAKELSQTLYKLGYTDIQVFEQFEVTEFQD